MSTAIETIDTTTLDPTTDLDGQAALELDDGRRFVVVARYSPALNGDEWRRRRGAVKALFRGALNVSRAELNLAGQCPVALLEMLEPIHDGSDDRRGAVILAGDRSMALWLPAREELSICRAPAARAGMARVDPCWEPVRGRSARQAS